MPDRLESNTRTVTVLTAFSRITGLMRDSVLAFFFGVTELMSSFSFAFLIPNLFRRLFGEGALGASFLPIYSQLHKKNPEHAAQLASLLLAGLLVVLGALVVVGESVLFLMSAMRDHNDNAIWLLMVMLPYMPLVCLVAILGAMLHVHGRFGPPALAPLLLNGAMIVTAIGVGMTTGELTAHSRLVTIGAIACSVVLAGLLQVAWMLWSLRGKVHLTWNRAGTAEPLGKILRAAGPMMLGMGVLQLNTFMDGIIASYPNLFGTGTIFGQAYPLDTDSMAILAYAQRVYQFPLGVFGIAVATAIYPLLAHQSDDEVGFASTVRRGLRLVLFIGLPASIGLALVREPLVACIFQRGAFTASNTVDVSAVLLGYAVAIWAYSANHVLTRTYYAKLDMKTPVRIAIQMVGLNLLLNLVLIWTPLRISGLAWSTAICAVLQCVLLLRASGIHVRHPLDKAVRNSALQSLSLALVMGASVALVMLGLEQSDSLWTNLLNLSLLVTVGAVVYCAGAMMFRMPELRWAMGRR